MLGLKPLFTALTGLSLRKTPKQPHSISVFNLAAEACWHGGHDGHGIYGWHVSNAGLVEHEHSVFDGHVLNGGNVENVRHGLYSGNVWNGGHVWNSGPCKPFGHVRYYGLFLVYIIDKCRWFKSLPTPLQKKSPSPALCFIWGGENGKSCP